MYCGERDTANKYCVLSCVGSVLSGWTTLGLPQPKPACTSQVSTAQAPGHCPKWALHFVHFAGLSCLGSWLLSRGTDTDGLCVLCASQIQAAQSTGCLMSALSEVGCASYSPPWSRLLGFPGVPREHSPRCAMCLFWGLILGCDTPGRCQPSRIPGRHG